MRHFVKKKCLWSKQRNEDCKKSHNDWTKKKKKKFENKIF